MSGDARDFNNIETRTVICPHRGRRIWVQCHFLSPWWWRWSWSPKSWIL